MPPSSIELDPFTNPTFVTWLLGQSVAFVTVVLCLGAWLRSLSKLLKEARAELHSERERSNELSDSLIQITEGHLRQRAKDIDDFALRSDSSIRNLLSFFEGLSKRPNITEISTAKKRLQSRVPPKRLSEEDEDPTPMPGKPIG